MTLTTASKLCDYPLGDISQLAKDRLRSLRWEGFVEGCDIARNREITKSFDTTIKNHDKKMIALPSSASISKYANKHAHQPLKQQEYKKIGGYTNKHNAIELTDKKHNIVHTRNYQYSLVGENNQKLFGYSNAPAFNEYYTSQPERGRLDVREVPEGLRKKKRSKLKLKKKKRIEQPIPMDIDEKPKVRSEKRRDPTPMDIDEKPAVKSTFTNIQSNPRYKDLFNSLGDNYYSTAKYVQDSEGYSVMEGITDPPRQITKNPQTINLNQSWDVPEIKIQPQNVSSSAYTPLKSTPLKRKPRSKKNCGPTTELFPIPIRSRGSRIVELGFDGDLRLF